MKTKEYNKLVRDKIPEIIQNGVKSCEVRVLGQAEYLNMLDKKLDEELLEYRTDKTVEELADMLEVIYALAKTHGVSREQLEDLRAKKAQERGGFDNKILLINVTQNN